MITHMHAQVVRTSALASGLARVHRLKHGAPVATDLAQMRVENAINDADDHGYHRNVIDFKRETDRSISVCHG